MRVMAETGRWKSVAVKFLVLRCPSCGSDKPTAVHHVRLNQCLNVTGRDFYSWDCKECAAPQAKPADTHSFCLLVGAGVPILQYTLPDEATDPLRAAHRGWSPYDVFDLQADIDALPTTGEAA